MDDFFKENKPASSDFMTSIVEGFKYNLEVVPDTLLVTIGLFALLLQSPSFTALGLSMLSVNLFQPIAVQYLREVVPNSWAVSTRSTGKFPGASAERVMMNNNSTTKAELPSYYSMFIGTFLGWVAPLSAFYQPELRASPQRMIASYVSIAFLIIFATIILLYRWLASQETLYGLLLGVGFGAALGFAIMLILYYGTQRRATNIYNLPLINVSYGGTPGRPIYVCAPK